jgi:hypothetical protein
MSPEEIVSVVNSNIVPRLSFHLSSADAPFQGTISRDGFKMSRTIYYRNCFRPLVSGAFLPCDSGIKVAVRMNLDPFVTVFMCIWFGGVGLFWLIMFASVVSGNTPVSSDFFVPFGMLVFGWAVASCGFWIEAKKQKQMLIQMFKGLETREQPAEEQQSKSTRSRGAKHFWWRTLSRILAFVVGWNLYWRLIALAPGHPLDGETSREITIAFIVHGLIGGLSLTAAVAVYKLLYGRLTREEVEQ